MSELKLGVLGTSRKENEFRLPIHPEHFERIDGPLRSSIFLERGYGERFGASDDELETHVGGLRSREELIEDCDVILLPKPLAADLTDLREGQILWGWPHCVQDEKLTQNAIDRRLTLIAWEAMNHWASDGSFGLHVFHKNNELAGYCSVLHAMRLQGRTATYGRPMRAAVISFGATGRGAVTAYSALGITDVTILTHRDPTAVASPIHTAQIIQFGTEENSDRLVAFVDSEAVPIAEFLGAFDIVSNCVLQDPEDPYMFVAEEELKLFGPGSMIVDVSCDRGMGFEWARPTSFEDPMFDVGDRVHYYAVDHSPSYLWNSSTWEISEALLPYLPSVLGGPDGWTDEPTIAKAIEIRDGVIQNPKILSFQGRAEGYPHPKA